MPDNQSQPTSGHTRSSPDIVEELIHTAAHGPDRRRADLMLRAAAEIARLRFVVKTLRYEAESDGGVGSASK